MNKIKVFIKIPFFFYILIHFAMQGKMSYEEVLVLFLIIAVNVYKERFSNSIFLVVLSFCLIFYGIILERNFGILLCITAFDLIYKKIYYCLVPILCVYFLFFINQQLPSLLLILFITSLLAYFLTTSEKREILYKSNLDNERRLRYELEQVRSKLLISAKETAHLAEVSERNRIAREIHDNLGHSVAGILIQLQASHKLFNIDNEKSKEILKKSIDGLAASVTLIRDTVHNLKPKESLGVEYIKTIIDNFKFCPVEFRFSGDFNALNSEHFGVIGSNIKEALTNAARYSKATRIEIKIDINEKFIRVYMKDDGVGCSKIKEGLGLSGMKERIGNMGGSISINSEDGFMIVFLIPIHNDALRGKNS